MQTTIFTLNKSGKLSPVDTNAFNDLEPGVVLHWGGNYGYSERDYCILERKENTQGALYWCYDIDHPDENAHLKSVQSYSIKNPEDPEVWHSQHFFITDEKVSPETIAEYKESHLEQARTDKESKDAACAEGDRLEAIGRELWVKFIGDALAVIVAEHERNTSDGMVDYFGSVTTDRVILAPSKNTRNNFQEFRKAAEIIEETKHLGIGKGRFFPYVKICKDFTDNGSCYYKGQHSPWHHELDKNDSYESFEFQTLEETQAHIKEKGEPHPIKFDEQVIEFEWDIDEREIEHRENYTGGNGYYLGYDRYSGWQVSKYTFWKGEPQRSDYIALAKRHDHFEKSKPSKPAHVPASETPADSVGYRVEYDRDWTWVYFDAKPSEEIREALKSKGGRWSRRRAGWYFCEHLEENEISSLIGESQDSPEEPKETPTQSPKKADPLP